MIYLPVLTEFKQIGVQIKALEDQWEFEKRMRLIRNYNLETADRNADWFVAVANVAAGYKPEEGDLK